MPIIAATDIRVHSGRMASFTNRRSDATVAPRDAPRRADALLNETVDTLRTFVLRARRARRLVSSRFSTEEIPMSVATPVAHGSPLAALFGRYHAAWEMRDPDLIASLHSEDSVFWVHDGSAPVEGRDALRRHCAGLFAAFDFALAMGRQLYGDDHWIFEWTMVLSLAEPDGSPFTARVEMLDVVTVNPQGEVARKDVYMNGKQAQAAFARAGIER